MTPRTALRRTSVLGLGALGALALAAPASALDAGTAVDAATQVVDPLTAPLQPTVEEVLAPVVEQAPAPVKDAVAPGGPAPTAPTGTDPQTVPGGSGQPGPGAPADSSTPPAAGGQARVDSGAPAAGGTGTAAMPSSFTASSAGLEGLTGRGAGFGTAANPMSLFGAPQVAAPLAVSEQLPTPLAVAPAGGALADVLPVDAPEGLPGALVALAATVVAGTVAAHVAALRTRRDAVTA